jgi:hypothetical protein
LASGLILSIAVNGMLILYCANLLFLSPLAYDRLSELTHLEREDTRLKAQRASLEKTQRGLIQQKEQLLQHYKETESVGKKLSAYKEKLAADAIEVKNAEATAEQLMTRLADAQGNTIATKQRLKEEKDKLEKARKELDVVLAEQKRLQHQENVIKRSQQEDALVKVRPLASPPPAAIADDRLPAGLTRRTTRGGEGRRWRRTGRTSARGSAPSFAAPAPASSSADPSPHPFPRPQRRRIAPPPPPHRALCRYRRPPLLHGNRGASRLPLGPAQLRMQIFSGPGPALPASGQTGEGLL